ncbi:hypothetical protein FG379_001136 [Cryptosporidium bovis]|uniref:uncharacterized protein n=1 Tax=Cryptosporidium bovis TaxID=310047 RepID=UPI00351A6B9D|nr:hypothetical protein FG379_001136 [Cryptosporidium bovis]
MANKEETIYYTNSIIEKEESCDSVEQVLINDCDACGKNKLDKSTNKNVLKNNNYEYRSNIIMNSESKSANIKRNFRKYFFSVKKKLKKTNKFFMKLRDKIKYINSIPLDDKYEELSDDNSSKYKTSVNRKFSSLMLNNIYITEDVDIRAETNVHSMIKSREYSSCKSTSLEETSIDVDKRIHYSNNSLNMGVNACENKIVNNNKSISIENNVKSLNGNNSDFNRKEKIAFSELINSCINGKDNSSAVSTSQISLHEILKGARTEKSDEYLKRRFLELEEYRKSLSDYLNNEADADEPNVKICSNLNNNSNLDIDKRTREYIKLARKLSDVSFECLLTSPVEQLCQLVYNKDGIKVWKKENKSGRVLIRTEFIVPVPPIEYLEYVTDSNNRKVYDSNSVELKTLERIFPGLEVMYVGTKRIATVYPRDIVNIRFVHGFSIKDGLKIFTKEELNLVENKSNQENFIFCSCSCSIKHPNAPERQGFVRMDLSIGSYMAIPIKTPFGIWSSISMFNEASPRGWIPSSVTRMIAAKMVPGSVENIISSMLSYYKLPYRNKITRPYSGFCNRVLSILYTDYRKYDMHKINDSNNVLNGGNLTIANNQKSSKGPYSRLSFLFNKPLLISIDEFIALYKSNTLSEFIEQFNGVCIINRIVFNVKLISSSLNHIDLISSSTDASRQISLEFTNSKSIDSNISILLMLQKQESKLTMYNISSEKISINTNTNANDLNLANKSKIHLISSRNMHFEKPSLEKLSSFEFSETTSVIDHFDKGESKSYTDNIESKDIHIALRKDSSGNFLKIFGSSQIFDMGDPETLSSIFVSG